ncbi:MAG: hypothetical protein C3F13_16775 [Anaerolineales bacterium]|nr:GNAT family N-acetyltransferase [Anaerolineae bacterium]PWB50605.1 MAG: hypothetical protein C3F13_16775 [Anaerolineales bacterium]
MSDNQLANYSIREMHEADLDFAAECTANEGWLSEDRTTLEGSIKFDPHGCFIAEQNNRPAGMCIATQYGKSGFIGELIVHSDQRGKNLGARLLKQSIAYLKEGQAETIYLDGVLKAVPLYEWHGFRKVCRSWRFSANLDGRSSRNVRPMKVADLEQVCELDMAAFGADRSFFIRRRLEIYPELSYVMEENEKINGYITGRGYPERLYAGPWIVEEKIENPQDLLLSLALQARGRPISVGVLDVNLKACALVRSLGFEARDDSPWRMSLGWPDDLGTSPTCFAIGSAAKG